MSSSTQISTLIWDDYENQPIIKVNPLLECGELEVIRIEDDLGRGPCAGNSMTFFADQIVDMVFEKVPPPTADFGTHPLRYQWHYAFPSEEKAKEILGEYIEGHFKPFIKKYRTKNWVMGASGKQVIFDKTKAVYISN